MDQSRDIARGHCQCRCGGRTRLATRNERSLGVVKGEPRRFLPGHHRRKPDRYATVQLAYESECWIWKLARNRDGYGVVRDGAGMKLAHRVEYEKHEGAIPDGLTLDHLCKERGCVNPAHLQPVSLAENCRRGSRTKLTPEQVREIRSSSETQHVLARRYGVTQGHISRIKRRQCWGDLP
jgi:HNH endonuclease